MVPDTPEALNAQLLDHIVELEREVSELRAERDALLAAQQGVTSASVHEALQTVLAQYNGKITAAARALGYAAPGTFRRILAQGDRISGTTAAAVQKRIDALSPA